jgi:hypothetical protein
MELTRCPSYAEAYPASASALAEADPGAGAGTVPVGCQHARGHHARCRRPSQLRPATAALQPLPLPHVHTHRPLTGPHSPPDLLLLALLNRASRYATFSSVTNPYQCRVDGLLCVSHPRSRLLQFPPWPWLWFVLTVSISPPSSFRTASSDTRDNPSMTSRSISIRARVPRPFHHQQQHINHRLVDVFRRCSLLTRWVAAVFRLQLTLSGSWRTR